MEYVFVSPFIIEDISLEDGLEALFTIYDNNNGNDTITVTNDYWRMKMKISKDTIKIIIKISSQNMYHIFRSLLHDTYKVFNSVLHFDYHNKPIHYDNIFSAIDFMEHIYIRYMPCHICINVCKSFRDIHNNNICFVCLHQHPNRTKDLEISEISKNISIFVGMCKICHVENNNNGELKFDPSPCLKYKNKMYCFRCHQNEMIPINNVILAKTESCAICFDDLIHNKTIVYSTPCCDIEICIPCLRELIKSEIINRKFIMQTDIHVKGCKIKCINTKCSKMIMMHHMVISLIDQKTRSIHNRNINDDAMLKLGMLRCDNPKCGLMYFPRVSYHYNVCPNCCSITCRVCQTLCNDCKCNYEILNQFKNNLVKYANGHNFHYRTCNIGIIPGNIKANTFIKYTFINDNTKLQNNTSLCKGKYKIGIKVQSGNTIVLNINKCCTINDLYVMLNNKEGHVISKQYPSKYILSYDGYLLYPSNINCVYQHVIFGTTIYAYIYQNHYKITENENYEMLNKIYNELHINMRKIKTSMREIKLNNHIGMSCPECKESIIHYEEHGCHKMTCSKGHHFCYQCGESISGYDHFKNGSCSVYCYITNINHTKCKHSGCSCLPCPDCKIKTCSECNGDCPVCAPQLYPI